MSDLHGHAHAHGEPTSPLGFTGERVLPDEPEWAWCFQAHKFGYDDLAERIAPGANVLDIGCGEGYGVELLARTAGEVVGCDYALEAVRHARDRYGTDRKAWLVCDAQHLPFKPGAFDVVSSLQVIEHFRDTDAHLRGVAQTLRPDGWHYVATPNIKQMSEAEAANEFHLRDFTAEDLRRSLAEHFAQVDVAGMFYREDSPRVRAMRDAEAREQRDAGRLARTERWLAKLPGRVRVTIRPTLRAVLGITDANAARNAILASDFEARSPAEESFCLIGIARGPRTS